MMIAMELVLNTLVSVPVAHYEIASVRQENDYDRPAAGACMSIINNSITLLSELRLDLTRACRLVCRCSSLSHYSTYFWLGKNREENKRSRELIVGFAARVNKAVGLAGAGACWTPSRAARDGLVKGCRQPSVCSLSLEYYIILFEIMPTFAPMYTYHICTYFQAIIRVSRHLFSSHF